MNTSLSFITRTASVSESTGHEGTDHPYQRELQVLGYHSDERKVYLLEHFRGQGARAPQLHSIRAHGVLAGRMSSAHDLDDHDRPARDDNDPGARLAAFERQLTPLFPVDERHFHMSTRVTKRRAVRIEPNTIPVRKYDLRITVRPVAQNGQVIPMGARKTVTAYLRPRARLTNVWVHPRLSFALALVSYVGMPFDIGYERQSALYVPLPSELARV